MKQSQRDLNKQMLTVLRMILNQQNSNTTVIESVNNNITNLNDLTTWDMVPGNSKEIDYSVSSTPGSDPKNPSGDEGNAVQIRFYDSSDTLSITQDLFYDTNNNVIRIQTS